jgi:CRP-like cAMP-binding protein
VKLLASNVRSVLLSASEVGPLLKLRRDTILFEQKQDAKGLFLIETGLVKLIRNSPNGSKVILAIAGANQLVGEEALVIGEGTYAADVVCLTEVTGYQIPLQTVERLFAIPEMANALMSYALFRDRERIDRIEMLSLYDVEHRILHGLAELAQLVKPGTGGTTYAIPMTQLEIASFVGATRETTSTTLSQLQDRHLVTLGRRMVTTVHPDTLRDAANSRLSRGRNSGASAA